MKPGFVSEKILLAAALPLALTLPFTAAASLAEAQTYTALHSFTGAPDGMLPVGGLVADKGGNHYGTTQGGGASNMGTVFEVTASGAYTILHNFNGANGKYPSSALICDAHGALFGTTYSGGASGLGTIFRLRPANGKWHIEVLHSFTGAPDGKLPVAGLVRDGAGNLYGATGFGGANNDGVVFKLDTGGNESVLYSFAGNADGAYPLATLTLDHQGNLYGVTTNGGAHGFGTVFSLSPSGVEKVLYSFAGAPNDGAAPYYSSLVRHANGDLYGTTYSGGRTAAFVGGLGTAFKVSSSGSESVVYMYCSLNLCQDGSNPIAGLTPGSKGTFYGTDPFAYYNGALYSLTTNGQYTLLYQFTDNKYGAPDDGAMPYGTMIKDASGALYGTTYGGGSTGGQQSAGLGSVFKFVP